MRLTDTAIKALRPAEKPQKATDGGGLYLLVQPAGGKWWRFDYRVDGKRKTLSMGTYPEVGLKLARERRDEARELLAQGIDPGQVRKEAKQEQATIVAAERPCPTRVQLHEHGFPLRRGARQMRAQPGAGDRDAEFFRSWLTIESRACPAWTTGT